MTMMRLNEEEIQLTPTPHPIPDPTPPQNYFSADRHLQLALARYYANNPDEWQWAEKLLGDWGAVCAQEIEPLYTIAEKNDPVLKQFDRRGERVDEIIYHPSYRQIEQRVYGFGMAAMSNVADFQGRGSPASQLLKFAAMYEYCQAEGSISCPVSMTDILARVLNKYAAPELVARYMPHLTSLDCEELYTGAMFLTEKAGGSDVGATTTIARKVGDHWELSGDKWFCSNVGADLILTLARPEGGPAGTRGLGLFLVPRVLPDSTRNSYQINRLKDKLGTRAMASGEVTFNRTVAYVIEPLERGFVMMMEMVNGTRLHSAIGGAAAARRAVVEAVSHARERKTFGKVLSEQPLMAEQLADLIVESEATTSLCMETAYRLDQADKPGASREEGLLSRLLITLSKRYATSRGVQGAQTAMEVRGGIGYIEDWPNARSLRDAYVNIIWEGGINMVAFDVLRTLDRENVWPVYSAALERELAKITSPLLDEQVTRLREDHQQLGKQVDQIMSWSRAAQEIAAPQLSDTMAGLYAAVLLLAEADFSANTRTEAEARRASQSARRYQTRFLSPALQKLARFRDEADDTIDLIGGAI